MSDSTPHHTMFRRNDRRIAVPNDPSFSTYSTNYQTSNNITSPPAPIPVPVHLPPRLNRNNHSQVYPPLYQSLSCKYF
jgi:hypothetical protein